MNLNTILTPCDSLRAGLFCIPFQVGQSLDSGLQYHIPNPVGGPPISSTCSLIFLTGITGFKVWLSWRYHWERDGFTGVEKVQRARELILSSILLRRDSNLPWIFLYNPGKKIQNTTSQNTRNVSGVYSARKAWKTISYLINEENEAVSV